MIHSPELSMRDAEPNRSRAAESLEGENLKMEAAARRRRRRDSRGVSCQPGVDSVDRRLLQQLMLDSRISNQDLANAIHLSPSPCLRRHKLLEQDGVILGYTAIAEPGAIGFGVAAFVEICLEKSQIDPEHFYRIASSHEEVAGCHSTAGDFDYLLKVLAPDMRSLTFFIKEKLRRIPGVTSTKVNLVIDPQPGIFAFYNYFHPAAESQVSTLPLAPSMDELDRRLLIALVRNARIPNVELARELGLSPSSCLRRLRTLENAGVIRGYTTVVDPAALGLSLVAFVGLRLRQGVRAGEEELRSALASRPEVAALHETAGNVDFMLRVVASDVDAFGRFVRECLRQVSAIEEMYCSFAVDPAPVLFVSYRFRLNGKNA